MTKEATEKGRGRPRKYDPETALEAATQVFWQKGLAGTTVDDIAAATGMNKPSLYGAFGEKTALYRTCLSRYNAELLAQLEQAINGGQGLKKDLLAFYQTAIERYSTDRKNLGCFTFSTTQTRELRAEMKKALNGIDSLLTQRIQQAFNEQEIHTPHDVEALTNLATSLFLSLSLRVKAGQRKKISMPSIKACLDVIFDD